MYRVVVDYAPTEADNAIVREGITAFNASILGERDKAFSIFLKNDMGEVFGGIQAFMGTESIYIDVLWVDENLQKQGYGTKLLGAAEQEAVKNGCVFSAVDSFDFQAEEFYLKNGYERFGELKNCWFGHSKVFLRKNLISHNDTRTTRKVMRIGVYGLVMEQGKILTVRQKRGPYAGKFDFPGGGIEFSESVEQALRREFLEEVAMEFESISLIANLSTTIQVNQTAPNSSYMFHHIGMLYQIEGCRLINNTQVGDLEHRWANLKTLSEEECSALLWKYRMTLEKLL